MTVPVTAIIITKLVIRPFYMAPQYTLDDCPDAVSLLSLFVLI